jgi:Holliday junction DNA helicase RuvA
MIHSLAGTFDTKGDNFAVVNVGGVGYKVFGTKRFLESAEAGSPAKIFTHYYLRENAAELYGFPAKEELTFFELLTSVSGVGPKSALSIMNTAPLKDLTAALNEGRPDLLTQASGIGRKTAERVVVELRGKLASISSHETVARMEKDVDLTDTLTGLGYRRHEAQLAIAKIPKEFQSLEERLKAVLRILHK